MSLQFAITEGTFRPKLFRACSLVPCNEIIKFKLITDLHSVLTPGSKNARLINPEDELQIENGGNKEFTCIADCISIVTTLNNTELNQYKRSGLLDTLEMQFDSLPLAFPENNLLKAKLFSFISRQYAIEGIKPALTYSNLALYLLEVIPESARLKNKSDVALTKLHLDFQLAEIQFDDDDLEQSFPHLWQVKNQLESDTVLLLEQSEIYLKSMQHIAHYYLVNYPPKEAYKIYQNIYSFYKEHIPKLFDDNEVKTIASNTRSTFFENIAHLRSLALDMDKKDPASTRMWEEDSSRVYNSLENHSSDLKALNFYILTKSCLSSVTIKAKTALAYLNCFLTYEYEKEIPSPPNIEFALRSLESISRNFPYLKASVRDLLLRCKDTDNFPIVPILLAVSHTAIEEKNVAFSNLLLEQSLYQGNTNNSISPLEQANMHLQLALNYGQLELLDTCKKHILRFFCLTEDSNTIPKEQHNDYFNTLEHLYNTIKLIAPTDSQSMQSRKLILSSLLEGMTKDSTPYQEKSAEEKTLLLLELGDLYLDLHKSESAYKIADRLKNLRSDLIATSGDAILIKKLSSYIDVYFARVYLEQKNTVKAKAYLQKASAYLSTDSEYDTDRLVAYHTIAAQVYFNSNKNNWTDLSPVTKALEHIEIAIDIYNAKHSDLRPPPPHASFEQFKRYNLCAKIQEKLGDKILAKQMSDCAKHIKSSLRNLA